MSALLIGCRATEQGTPWLGLEGERSIGATPDAPLPSPDPFLTQLDEQLPDMAGEGLIELSVEQAVMLALRNNRALRVQLYRPLIIGTFEDLERAVYDPVLRAELATEYDRRRLAGAGDTFSDTESQRQIGRFGWERFFPTGTRLGLDMSFARETSDRTDDAFSPRVGVTLSQALLRGGDMEANLAAIRQAEIDTLASEFELRGFIEALVADVEGTFWVYALARREIEIFESSVELAEQQLREARQRVQLGAIARTELAAGEAELARRQEELINAQSALKQFRLRLLRLIDPTTVGGWDRQLDPLGDIVTPEITFDPVVDHLAVARVMRPELNEARLLLDRGRLEVIRTRDGLLPRLDLFLTLGKSGYAESFGDAFSELFRASGGWDLSAGLAFEYPWGNRAAEALHRRARFTRDEAEESLQNLGQLVELDVRLAYEEVDRTHRLINATQVTRQFRQESLAVEQARFQLGATTSFIVAQVQRDLLESQIAEVRALVEHRLALIELYRMEGSLLLRRGITAPGQRDAP